MELDIGIEPSNPELTFPLFRRTIAFTMPAGFDTAFGKVRELVADPRANEKFQEAYTNRCDGLGHRTDTLVYDLYALTPDEIKIVEGATQANA